MRRFIAWVAVAVALAGISSGDAFAKAKRRPFPKDLTALFDSDAAVYLLALDPERLGSKTKDKILSFPVTKTVPLDAASRRTILTALRKDIERGGEPADCFNPRHGLRFVETSGATRDVAICFECSQLVLVGEGSNTSERPIANRSETVLDSVLAGKRRSGKPSKAAN